ncbi:putative RNA-binding Zn ribbon-like protein [Actinocrispum wychmicini]|uniref:Putative RNA-binding Zn ribbon-like protein n=1 Tax=Actinocrispum wychmicini TaxID=1213861 RepID=A0A4V2S4W1_9PSEU|nr:putative RNA-binding Zn ribbon-like protein [Actinocrispum wychmicini]
MLGEPLPVELMNTVWADRDGVHDSLDSPAGLADWLAAVRPRLPHLPESGPLPLAEFRRLRDALRVLAAAVTEDTRSTRELDVESAVDVLNASCAYAPNWSAMTWPDTLTKIAAQPFADAALSIIAEEAVALFAGPDRSRLRACYAPTCVLFFIRNHPRREWCSASCGNRARVARHYRRHHADSEQGRS